MDHLKLRQPFVQPNLVVPLKTYIHWTLTYPSLPLLHVIWFVEESRLIAHVAAERKEHQLVVSVLLLIDHEHDSVRVAQLTVRVHRIKYSSERFRKLRKVKEESGVLRSFLLLWRQQERVKLRIMKVKSRRRLLFGLYRLRNYVLVLFIRKLIM
jgi:hypothetical protein